MIPIDLTQQTIILTGALGAIAEHVVRQLAEAGATLILTDALSDAEAAERLRQWGCETEKVSYRRMDVTSSQDVDRVAVQIFKDVPHIDVVLSHAGGCQLHPFSTTAEEEFDRIFRLNYHAHVYVTRAVLKEWMERQIHGHLIFTSSMVASLPWPDVPAYVSAKAAVEAFMKCVALDYARHGIRANAIAPGIVAAGSALKVYEENSDYRAMADRVIPLGHLTPPEAVANAFVWLCSPLAQEMTGQVVRVDSGMSLPKVG